MNLREPIAIAVAIVQRGQEVLIGRRNPGAVLGGLWEFPGGKILAGESEEEAACRECWEETGLRIRMLESLGIVEHDYGHGRVRLFFFLAETLDPGQEPVEPFRWVARSDLGRYSFPAANAAIVEKVADC